MSVAGGTAPAPWSKQQVAPLRLELGSIGFQRTGIAVKVLMRQKLQAVDKDAGHGGIAVLAGMAYQGQMPFVQIAHGRHKGRAATVRQGLAQVFDGVNDVHDGCLACSMARPVQNTQAMGTALELPGVLAV